LRSSNAGDLPCILTLSIGEGLTPRRTSALILNLSIDEVLLTTRAVRRRLDLERPVERDVILDCIRLAVQAPSGSNKQSWHFVIVTDPALRRKIADLYRLAYREYAASESAAGRLFQDDEVRRSTQRRVQSSAEYLAEHFHEVPVLLIPCFTGRVDGASSADQAGTWGSVIPAAWSFMLAARSRGLGSCWTSLHLEHERETAAILGIPYDSVTQVALIAVAYSKGTDFRPAKRQPLEEVVHWDGWASTRLV
jgi:nitroreductase